MKKIITLVITVLMAVGLCACDNGGVAPMPVPENEEKNYPRTEDISEGRMEDGSRYTYFYDLDFDEEKEEINLEIMSVDDWESEMNIEIGSYEKTVEIIDWGMIEKVYACDIDTEDGVMDIAIITNEQSSDPRIRIFKYDEDLTPYEFSYEDYTGERVTYDDKWLGYAINYYFNVNDDDTITMEEQTDSTGMWSVYKTYERNSSGEFCEVEPEKYEILPDFMEGGYGSYEVTGKEKTMWDKGYIKAYIDFESGDMSISEGEYFKVLYDDGEDNIYIEKEDGTEGWIYIGYDAVGRDELNQYFFYLAG